MELRKRAQSRKAKVSLQLFALNFPETDLKRRFIESGPTFQESILKNCTDWDWKTEPQALLKSKVQVYAEFELNWKERLQYSLAPLWFKNRQENELKYNFLNFFQIGGKQEGFSKPKESRFKRLFQSPRSILFSSLSYHSFYLFPPSPFELIESPHLPLFFEGKIECFVRIYQLKRINYLWKTRIFEKPEPYVGELYIKVKEKYNNGSYGTSFYEFVGRFLPVMKDVYLLDYWGLCPIRNKDILNLIPQDLFRRIGDRNALETFKENFNLTKNFILSQEKVKELMNSDDQVSTFSHSHQG